MNTLDGPSTRTHPVWQDRVRMRVVTKGQGPPLIFLHGPWGLHWDPFLDTLARHFTVHAPEHPGTTPGAPDDVSHLDNLWDLVLCYDELLERMGVEGAAVVGHSFGAMVACELAAAYPRRVGRLALIDPIGLWRDDAPVINWMMLNAQEMPAQIFRDPAGAGARLLFAQPEDETARIDAQVGLTWAMGATGKFIWPIPDKGLRKRIHRVKAPTLLVWGAEDRVAPPVYAEEFARHIAGARIESVKGAGHAPHLEEPAAVAECVRAFLRA
jgi:pimeloyl-ACP methyl ester carboxylesterase